MSDIKLVINGQALLMPHFGLGVYTQRLIDGLLMSPWRDSFRVIAPKSEDFDSSSDPTSVLRPFPSSTIPHPLLREMWYSWRVSQIAARDYPEAVFHSPVPLWSTVRPRRTVVTLHDCLYRRFPLYMGRYGLRRWYTLAKERYAGASSLILTVSEFSKNDLVQLAGLPREKIQVLHNWVGTEFIGVDRGSEGARVRSKYQLPQRYWLYIGGYDYRKNVALLIQSYAKALSQGAICPPLVLAGTIPASKVAPFSDPVGDVQKAGIPSTQIFFAGPIEGADLPGLYAGADLLVYPSLGEGFGLPPLEAMAVGTSVLVSDSTSLPEVVSRAECRFDPKSSESLAERLIQAAQDTKAFQNKFSDCFTQASAMRSYEKILKFHGDLAS